jgi:hypothetical protein
MRTSDTITKIAPAVVAAASELGPIGKDAVNPAFRNKYATLDAIMEQVRPVLARHGLAVLQGVLHPETVDGVLRSISVETRLLHTSGEWIASSVALPVEKVTSQGIGSATSYGRRYGLSAILGLTADDDDGNAASSRPEARPAPAKATVGVGGQGSTTDATEGKRLYETVPETPRRKPFSGDVGEALKTPFPFAKKPEWHKKPLGEVPTDVLEATSDWCRKTDADKFGDLIARIEAVLQYYFELEEEQSQADRRAADDDEPLPF